MDRDNHRADLAGRAAPSLPAGAAAGLAPLDTAAAAPAGLSERHKDEPPGVQAEGFREQGTTGSADSGAAAGDDQADSGVGAHLHCYMSGDWHRVGAGLSVRFTLRASHFEAEWRPRKPTKREFKRILNSYRRARYLFLDELARRNGRNVLCVELPA